MFDGSNYIQWKARLTGFLQTKGLKKFIERNYLETMMIQAENEEDEALALKAEIMNEKALGHIKCTIGDDYLHLIEHCTNAWNAWNIIATTFEGRETYNKIHLLEQLIEGKMKDPMQDSQSYISEKTQLVKRLANAGLNLPQELVVAILLAKLPESYETMRRILESQQHLTIASLTSEFNREALRRVRKRESSNTFGAEQERSIKKPRFDSRKEDQAMFARDGQGSSRFDKKGDKKLECDFCGG